MTAIFFSKRFALTNIKTPMSKEKGGNSLEDIDFNLEDEGGMVEKRR